MLMVLTPRGQQTRGQVNCLSGGYLAMTSALSTCGLLLLLQ